MSVEIKPVQQESSIFQCYLVGTNKKYWTLVELCFTSTVIYLFADLRVREFTMCIMSGYLCHVMVFYNTSDANGI